MHIAKHGFSLPGMLALKNVWCKSNRWIRLAVPFMQAKVIYVMRRAVSMQWQGRKRCPARAPFELKGLSLLLFAQCKGLTQSCMYSVS